MNYQGHDDDFGRDHGQLQPNSSCESHEDRMIVDGQQAFHHIGLHGMDIDWHDHGFNNEQVKSALPLRKRVGPQSSYDTESDLDLSTSSRHRKGCGPCVGSSWDQQKWLKQASLNEPTKPQLACHFPPENQERRCIHRVSLHRSSKSTLFCVL